MIIAKTSIIPGRTIVANLPQKHHFFMSHSTWLSVSVPGWCREEREAAREDELESW